MNFRLLRLSPIIVGAIVGIVLIALEYGSSTLPAINFLKRLEWITFDWRVRQALAFEQPKSRDLGLVYVDDQSLADIKKKLKVEWPVPRWVHGVILKELATQKASGVGYDIFFSVLRPEQKAPSRKGSETGSSDAVFAQEIGMSRNVVLGAQEDALSRRKRLTLPDPLFSIVAADVGHACSQRDEDGIIRRVPVVFLDEQRGQTWQLGIVMAARHLGLDLGKAQMDAWTLRVPDRSGKTHVIPLDGNGNLVVRWAFDFKSKGSATQASFSDMLGAITHRAKHGSLPSEPWRGKLALIGSTGGDPSINDRGATPLGSLTPFCAAHFNIANSILTGSYVHTSSIFLRIAILTALVTLVGWTSWRLRAVWATLAVAGLIAIYLGLSFWSYVQWGWWLPVAMPVLGAVCVTHSVMVLFRFFFERNHRRKLHGMFAHILSPDSLELLLQQPQVSWAPQERFMTVFFADIRGFTSLSAGAEQRARAQSAGGGGASLERTLLDTVNLYLSVIVEALQAHGATLDKYMGDCVMAFWGAPLDQPGHAATALRAALSAQRAVAKLNQEREAQNLTIRRQNEEGLSRGLAPKPALETLGLGIGINTGSMTVGFMGAESHLSNYTVFGHAVNIASRLQGVAGAGEIYFTDATRSAALEAAPELAEVVMPLGLLSLKGISEPVPTFEMVCDQSAPPKIVDAGSGGAASRK
ncbi:hypothetical protein AYO49_02720 [Verrucomicrobiaceae bacterium SCGC AG-212-N21]|nr:hypothetical protein AYO49_02720 [Verrucomicrobiaceae bacterium SCGC AG-212-N21]